MLFSQRIGVTPLPEALRPAAMPPALRNSLWNAFDGWRRRKGLHSTFLNPLWENYWKLPRDAMPLQRFGGEKVGYDKAWAFVREQYFAMKWFEVYDFLDFFIGQIKDTEALADAVNDVLKTELAAYRVVGRQLVPITDPMEVQALEEALSDRGKFSNASEHLGMALAHLSSRTNPDYRNSIKESISAVEAVAKVLSGKDKAELGDALAALEKEGKLHGALKRGYTALYGYTSDANGIRHALMEEENLNSDDAKFFLLACTSFVNYLKTIA